MVGDEVIGNLGEAVKPPQAQGREELTLAGDARFEYVIEGADPVAGDHKNSRGVREVGRSIRCRSCRSCRDGNIQVADLARIGVVPSGERAGGLRR